MSHPPRHERATCGASMPYQAELATVGTQEASRRPQRRRPIRSGPSPATCAGTTTTAAPVTSGSTTGARVATASSSRCASTVPCRPTSRSGMPRRHSPRPDTSSSPSTPGVGSTNAASWSGSSATRVHQRLARRCMILRRCRSRRGALRSRGVRVHPAISNRACVERGIEQHVLMRPSRPMR